MATTDNQNRTIWKRRLLPHHHLPGATQHVTFRLANSVPSSVLSRLNDECAHLSDRDRGIELMRRIEDFLDCGIADDAHLEDPKVAQLVETAVRHFDDVRYDLHAWVIMPNHVHVVFMPFDCEEVSRIVHSWKSFTAHRANALLGATGEFWYRDYFDRMIRNEKDLLRTIAYVENNPVKAGLCDDPRKWKFSSARFEHKHSYF